MAKRQTLLALLALLMLSWQAESYAVRDKLELPTLYINTSSYDNHQESHSVLQLRPILSTGAPLPSGATGTAIWSGQSAAIRFTAPSDVPPYGARLIQIQIVLRGGYATSNARLSVVEDSGMNSPGNRVLESRMVRVCIRPARECLI
jgi:hypothetical protein